jgi:hypothetical protein
LAAVAIGLVSAADAQGLTTNLPAAADAFLRGGGGLNDCNAGGRAHVAAGTAGILVARRGLFRFDLTGIPPESGILSA